MNEFLIFLPLDPYLREWFIWRHGGETPVRLNRASEESKLLRSLIVAPPAEYRPLPMPQELTPVIIPSYPGRDPRIYNFVGPAGINALVETIRDNFDYELLLFMRRNDFRHKRKDNLIYAWMELNHIEPTETNWNTIAKRYQRLRNALINQNYRERKKSKKSSRV